MQHLRPWIGPRSTSSTSTPAPFTEPTARDGSGRRRRPRARVHSPGRTNAPRPAGVTRPGTRSYSRMMPLPPSATNPLCRSMAIERLLAASTLARVTAWPSSPARRRAGRSSRLRARRPQPLVARALGRSADQAPPHPGLPAQDQRQGRTLSPNHGRGMTLRHEVPLPPPPPSSPDTLARLLRRSRLGGRSR